MMSVVAERISADYDVSHAPSHVGSPPNILKQVLEQLKNILFKGGYPVSYLMTQSFLFLNFVLMFLKKKWQILF